MWDWIKILYGGACASAPQTLTPLPAGRGAFKQHSATALRTDASLAASLDLAATTPSPQPAPARAPGQAGGSGSRADARASATPPHRGARCTPGQGDDATPSARAPRATSAAPCTGASNISTGRFLIEGGKPVGIPNTASKYAPSQPLTQHVTPFERRVERKLAEEEEAVAALALGGGD
ncbi:MAG: hypothetical protein J3K34DRAFT_516138 [Monoraphidium minutum]|nr:MAG: hypothetical protein J3K34DRAFT_516138 [Monoraphidium minutum]